MRVTVKLPRMGETVDEVVVLEWLKGTGEAVTEGEPLLAVETDKTNSEVPAPVSGTLVEQLVVPDDEISTGAAVAVVDAPD